MARNFPPAIVQITALDINGNNSTNTFSQVKDLQFDYIKGVVRILDDTGEFFFPYTPVTTVTYTITAGTANVVIS